MHARIFGLDLRGLAALRICCGLLQLVDLALRAQDLTAFYTKDGVLPFSIFAAHKAYVAICSCESS